MKRFLLLLVFFGIIAAVVYIFSTRTQREHAIERIKKDEPCESREPRFADEKNDVYVPSYLDGAESAMDGCI